MKIKKFQKLDKGQAERESRSLFELRERICIWAARRRVDCGRHMAEKDGRISVEVGECEQEVVEAAGRWSVASCLYRKQRS